MKFYDRTGIRRNDTIIANISPQGIPPNHFVEGNVRGFEEIRDGRIIISIYDSEWHEFPVERILRVTCGVCSNRKLYNQTDEKWICPWH